MTSDFQVWIIAFIVGVLGSLLGVFVSAAFYVAMI